MFPIEKAAVAAAAYMPHRAIFTISPSYHQTISLARFTEHFF